MQAKVFGIGLSRTGTHSLAVALGQLGYRAGHYDVAARAITVTDRGLRPDYAVVDTWDALTDIPIAAVYDQLDRHYARARFILTVREKVAWLDSCERHYAASRAHYTRTHGIELDRILALRRAVYGRETFSRHHFSTFYDQHLAQVRAHFEGRPSDLLTLDICGGKGWPRLCAFLSRPVPESPFPHENISKRQT